MNIKVALAAGLMALVCSDAGWTQNAPEAASDVPQASGAAPAPTSGTSQPTAQQLTKIRALQKKIEEEVGQFNTSPKRGFIGPNTKGDKYSSYYQSFKERVEACENSHYPKSLRGVHGSALMSVTIGQDGLVYHDEIKVLRSSGNPALDHEALEVLRRAQPYATWKSKDYQVYELVSRFYWEASKDPSTPSPAPPTEACGQDR